MKEFDAIPISQLMFRQLESEDSHREYNAEVIIYNMVRKGMIEELKESTSSLLDAGLGTLSKNPVRNFQYHLAICAAICARFCIESGMNLETAYTLSDLYIKKADAMTDVDSIVSLHKQLLFDFASRMRVLSNNQTYSTHIKQTFDFINDNIHTPLSVDDISDKLHINKSYLCTLFKKEVGMTIGSYIEQRRIDIACTYLSSTDLPYTEIYEHLCFSSQSHFTKVFKKNTNMTPSEYRRTHYHKNFKE